MKIHISVLVIVAVSALFVTATEEEKPSSAIGPEVTDGFTDKLMPRQIGFPGVFAAQALDDTGLPGVFTAQRPDDLGVPGAFKAPTTTQAFIGIPGAFKTTTTTPRPVGLPGVFTRPNRFG